MATEQSKHTDQNGSKNLSPLLVIKGLIAVTLFAALLAGVEYYYGWVDLAQEWKQVTPLHLLACACVMFASQFSRAWRVHRAYSFVSTQQFSQVAGVSLVHNCLSFLLPMRLGEAALPALSRLRLKVDIKYSTATLILIRIFDAHFLLVLLVFFAGHLWLNELSYALALLFLAMLPLCMWLMRIPLTRVKTLQFAHQLIENQGRWMQIYAITAFTWLIKIAALASLAMALGTLPIDHAWIATIIADGSALSPITGLANAGTYQAAFSLPLAPLGHQLEDSIKIAVNLHIFILLTNIVSGIIGASLLKRRETNK